MTTLNHWHATSAVMLQPSKIDHSIASTWRKFLTLFLMLLTTTAWAWEGSGTKNAPYQIKSTGDLNQLATDVNKGTNYEGTYFKLMNNISYSYSTSWNYAGSTENNYTPIGGYQKFFGGDFDGNGKTISGIRIYLNGNDHGDILRGLFGSITSTANIHDLTLADTRITGYNAIGGIVGCSEGTITNCHVANNVAIQSVFNQSTNAYSFGGIAGINSGTIIYCTSAVTITVSGSAGENYGAIAGENSYNGTLTDNFANGATIPEAANDTHGAIAGRDYSDTLKRNLYTNCTVADKTSNVGCNNADVTENGGAVNGTVLVDNADNSAAIDNLIDQANIIITGRTLYKDGAWNTLCLPFNVTIAGSVLEGNKVDVRTLSSTEFNSSTGELTLNFTDQGGITNLVAGTPYIIKWENGSNITNLVFTGITIDKTNRDVTTNYVNFCGTYSPIVWETNNTILFLGNSNKLYFPQINGDDKPHLNAFRGYFKLNGLTASEIQHARINFDENEENGIITTRFVEDPRGPSDITYCTNSNDWFTIDGRKLQGKPTTKGMYIHNGKKSVIK